ncbi:extracellular solute-binding protein [Desulfobacterales bacterium HSG17]|nr:extracellular solute-binding protein [Desulfobacterales bacterium HSG17]
MKIKLLNGGHTLRSGIKLNFKRSLKFLCFLLFLLIPLSVFAEEEVLRILTGQGHAPKKIIEQFEKQIQTKYQHKIKLEVTFLTGPDDWYKTIRGGKVDLVLLTHHHFKDKRFNYIKNHFLLPLDLKNIPNFHHVIPALQKADYLTDNGKIYGSPVSQGPYGLAYNTAILKAPPESWDILWDPRFKDKYIIGANEYIYNVNITALALGYSRETINNFDNLNNREFRKKLSQLAANSHSFWIGVDTADDLSGMTLATSWGDSLGPLNKRGKPWKMAEPIEGMPCWIDNYAITWTLKDTFLYGCVENLIR